MISAKASTSDQRYSRDRTIWTLQHGGQASSAILSSAGCRRYRTVIDVIGHRIFTILLDDDCTWRIQPGAEGIAGSIISGPVCQRCPQHHCYGQEDGSIVAFGTNHSMPLALGYLDAFFGDCE